jgi:LPXTG-motif cell wall-anchored protein
MKYITYLVTRGGYEIMRKFSFLSGLTAFALVFAPLGSSAFAEGPAEDLVVTEDVYGEVTWDVYSDVSEDVYGEVIDEVYGDVSEDVYGEVIDEVYGDVSEDVYGEVIDEVYGDVSEDVYGEVIDEVYGDVSEDVYEEVIEDVYEDFVFLPEDITSDVSFDYTGQLENENLVVVFYTDTLSSDEKTKSVIVNNGNVAVKIPFSELPENKGIAVVIEKLDVPGALGVVYDFHIYVEEGEAITTFTSPVTLTFVIDPSKVKNKADLKVVYINEKSEREEFLTPSVVEQNNKLYVTANVSHFSAYGVFEIATATSGTDVTNTGSTGTTGTGTVVTGNQTGTSTTTGTIVATATPTTTATSVTAAASAPVPTVATTGNALPNTATNSYNMLLAGLLLVALGGIVLIVKLRREMQVNQ